nr:UPF0235 protein C15orf40 homolog [Pocillopora verrucosa]
MFSRNFWFVRSKRCFDVFLWNLPFAGRSIISRWLICDPHRRMTKKIVAGLRTSARIMPKRGKVTRSTEQTLLKNKHEARVIESAISLTKDGQISVRVLAKPGAKQSNITDISSDGVGVQIAAPARDGEANEELVRYLAEVLNVRTRTISLDKGSKSRNKVVTVDLAEISWEQVKEVLCRAASQN